MTPRDKFVAGVAAVVFQSPNLVLTTHREHGQMHTVFRITHMDNYYKEKFNTVVRAELDERVHASEDPFRSGEWFGSAMIRELMGIAS